MIRVRTLGAASALAVGLLVSGCAGNGGRRAFEAGLTALERGEWVQAQTALEKSIARRPGHADNAVAYNGLGVALAQLGHLAEAEEMFAQALRLDPLLTTARTNQGLVRYQAGQADEAVPILEEAAEADPDDPRALLILARAQLDRGRPVAALDATRRAIGRAPDQADAWNLAGVIHYRQDRWDDARTHWQRALDLRPAYPEALWNFGRLEETRGEDPRACIPLYAEYLDRLPDGPGAPTARAALVRLDPDGAGAPFADREEPDPPPDPVDRLLRQARRAREQGEHGDAFARYIEAAEAAADAGRRIAVLEEAAREYADSPRAHLVLARALKDAGRNRAALEAGRRAVALNPRWAASHELVAEVAGDLRDDATAAASLRALTELTPGSREAWWSLAVLYRDRIRDAEQAEDTFRRFADRFPQDRRAAEARRIVAQYVRERERRPAPTPTPTPGPTPAASAPPLRVSRLDGEPSPARTLPLTPASVRDEATALQHYRRAVEYQRRNQPDDARTFFLRALEQDDRLARAYYNLAAIYQAQGDAERAIDAYQRALAADPAMHQAAYNLALIYLNRDLPAVARTRLEQVTRMAPDFPRAWYVLGVACNKLDQPADAARALRTFLRLAPDDPAAPQIRAWLEAHRE